MKPRTSSDEFYFDVPAADKICDLFERYLTHVKGEWARDPKTRKPQAFKLDDWQRDQIIRPLFGEKRRADGLRRYRTSYIEIPRKNGKSSLGAGLALALLFADDEPGAEVYSAASDTEQAAIVFDIAKQMVTTNGALRSRAKTFRRSIAVPKTASLYKVLSAAPAGKHGFSAHGIIFDELHAQPNRELWDVLTTSTGARRQPLIVAITTAGYDRHSICWEMHDYACKVRDGIIEDTSFLPVIYAADEKDDWRDPKVWAKANPGLGISPKLDYIKQKAAEAVASPAKENTFRRLHLNQWTEQDVRWLKMDAWDKCAGAVNPKQLRGRKCTGGLDLASTTDTASLALLFPPRPGAKERHIVLLFFWVPEENARQRGKRDRVPYPLWIKQGLIKATEGNVIDYDVIRQDINHLAGIYDIQSIGVDPWNSTQLTTQLLSDGLDVRTFSQGVQAFNEPTKALERLVISQQFAHGGNAVLRWMASNVSVIADHAGNIKPDKKKSTGRIDGIVATIMALGRDIVAPGSPSSVYEGRGIRTL